MNPFTTFMDWLECELDMDITALELGDYVEPEWFPFSEN